MAASNLIPTFEYLGTLSEEPYFSAHVAKRPGSEDLLLVNRISGRQKTRRHFKDLYAGFAKREERSEFIELFSFAQDFYAVFRYHQGSSLAELYFDCPGSPSKRMSVLISALFHIYRATSQLPATVICSVLQPDNIIIDENDDIRLRYLLQPEYLLENSECNMWEAAADLIEFMMEKELGSPYHKQLRAILKKCRAGLYPVFPALISDLQKIQGMLGQIGPVNSAKEFVTRKKMRLAQLSWLGMVTLFSFLFIYLFMELTGNEPLEAAMVTDIGVITYVAAAEEEADSLMLADPAVPASADVPIFDELPDEDSGLQSEDYIVQPTDTLETICIGKYGSGAYAEPIAAFNGLTAGEELEAGSILRLPLKDQLAIYLQD